MTPLNSAKTLSLEDCAIGFIEDIWNNYQFDRLHQYLHPNFVDYSLPKPCQNSAGLVAFLKKLEQGLIHKTVITKRTVEQNFAILSVTITLNNKDNIVKKDFDRVHHEIIEGHRVLAFCNGLIIGHWEFLHSPGS